MKYLLALPVTLVAAGASALSGDFAPIQSALTGSQTGLLAWLVVTVKNNRQGVRQLRAHLLESTEENGTD